ncbi:hypothetical protein CKO25_14805 [Thiocapsa imhoffii]|uniref:DsrE/DsrF-like family protein n=1 Tax=Thiocapsa imhoffii TaxID=382777 RepID=A0A9X0WJU0_9GAMM|nr:DsrE family protein [Thiocapsa imhoffii]MBK1645893.1 hypothetical protein [Thiocapsa imhoffii]
MPVNPFAILFSLSLGATALASTAEPIDVVYHLSEPERAAFVLNNMQNHIDGLGGPEHVNMVLVAHGPAVSALDEIEATDRVRSGVAALLEQGVAFEMCGNTLQIYNMEIDDLLPGFVEVSQGGVARIGQLQRDGYVYLRP